MGSTPRDLGLIKNLGIIRRRREAHDKVPLQHHMHEVHNLSLIKNVVMIITQRLHVLIHNHGLVCIPHS